MVAFTSTFALPYQQGTDAPCDAPEVWCDFTDELDSLLFGFDQTLGRLTPTIPMAKVVVNNTFQLFGSPTVVEFDTVEFDTDNMVDLDRINSKVVPRRNGTYYCVVTGEVSGTATAGGVLGVIVTDGFAGPSGSGFILGGNTEDMIRLYASADYKMRVSGPMVWDGTDTFGFGVVIENISAITLNFNKIEFTVYWISDRIS